MGPTIALACVMLLGSQGQTSTEWKRYRLEDGLTASFPKAPKMQTLTKGGQVARRYTALYGMGVYRIAAYSDTPEVMRQAQEELTSDPGGPAIRGLMNSIINGCNAELKGKISDTQFGGFKGFPMQRCRIDSGNVVVYVAAICSDKKLLCLLAAQPRGSEDLGRIQKFFDSVEL